MEKQKFDGVVEAAHFSKEGRLIWVRAYERRGATFSDRVLISRQELVQRLKSGRKFVTGKRLPLLSSTFETSQSLRLVGEYVVAGESHSEIDFLEGVPVI